MIVALLALFTLMLVESVIVYSHPGCYRLLFGLLEKCSRPAAAAGALLCGSCGAAALALAWQAQVREWEYLGWLAALLLLALALMLAVVACSDAKFRRLLREQLASISLARMRAYAAAAFLFSCALIAATIALAGF